LEPQVNPVYSAQEFQLSDAQASIWIAQAMDPASPAFNIAKEEGMSGLGGAELD